MYGSEEKTAGRAGGSGDQNVEPLFGGAELVRCFGDKEIGDGDWPSRGGTVVVELGRCRQEGR